MYKDVTTVLEISCCTAFNDLNFPKKVRDDYFSWVLPIAENANELTSQTYLSWLKRFNQYHSEYSSPIHSELSAPEALYSIIDSSPCF